MQRDRRVALEPARRVIRFEGVRGQNLAASGYAGVELLPTLKRGDRADLLGTVGSSCPENLSLPLFFKLFQKGYSIGEN